MSKIYQCPDCKKIFIITDTSKPKCNHFMAYETKLTTVNNEVGQIGV